MSGRPAATIGIRALVPGRLAVYASIRNDPVDIPAYVGGAVAMPSGSVVTVTELARNGESGIANFAPGSYGALKVTATPNTGWPRPSSTLADGGAWKNVPGRAVCVPEGEYTSIVAGA